MHDGFNTRGMRLLKKLNPSDEVISSSKKTALKALRSYTPYLIPTLALSAYGYAGNMDGKMFDREATDHISTRTT